MQFLLIAHDGTDPDAPARRQAVRPQHLEYFQTLKANGSVHTGMALLDDTQNMVGSSIVYECSNREELDAIIAADPYVKGNVWQQMEVREVRIAK